MAILPQRLAVIGAGQMGAGIAQVVASSGIAVKLVDQSHQALDKALAGIESSLARLVTKGRVDAVTAEAALGRLYTSTSLEDLHDVDYVVEAVPEREDLKLRLFASLDAVAPPHAILASNTSSISVTRLGAATRRPAQVLGLHFMNPVPIMGLVELVRGMRTSEDTFRASLALAARLGKQTCVSADTPGFIVNRLLMPGINEAFYALQEGVGSADDIDRGMRLGTNVPMGPLALADFIGLDTCLSIMQVLHSGLGDDKYRPCPLLRQHVDAGWLGKKAGRGVPIPGASLQPLTPMSASGESSPPDPERSGNVEGTLLCLRNEVEALQGKLGQLHGSDLVALRRAYASLSQHVAALEGEWDGTLDAVNRLQTAVVSPEYVAQELGVAGALAVGLTVLQHSLRGVIGRDVLSRGAWLLGAGVVVFRLTGGTLARWLSMVHANILLKRELIQRLRVVDDRIRIMAALQTLEMVERPEGEAAGRGTGQGCSEGELSREALRKYARLGKKR
ncbi:3-hydroxybutyryl-CoA dehydrogenase [Auxenochlorella protothecoides]|uniref:3-hydroxybutyryl-CoA dehydrogenase n=1 Tax=Auxenochlorella protothecoides TaxID=3075 RepID=A0A087SM58_AUXPR|nr:3-hydroxybutyryl-CoA dehydrogenase [Auxenochlorella protothecoides]KFM26812.1 3-hydroxybutyryl-CoA dehydrogenase [Auxenochlorella protothecoides]